MFYKVSVIIPVYNAEKHIAQCIESLLNQTLEECEFIFINDGSSDNSQQIIEHYQERDRRIKLISQSNQGVSSARNAGLKAASGEYIGFVDADDYVEKDMYEKLYTACIEGNYDAVISNFESEEDGYRVTTKYPFPVNVSLETSYIKATILPYFLEKDDLNSIWSKVYKTNVIKHNNIAFPEGISLGEDGWFNMNFMSHAVSITYLNYTGYHYQEVEGSATRNIEGKDYFKRALEVFYLDLPDRLVGSTDKEKIQELKSIRLINNVMSYTHVYFAPSKVSFKRRYKYVKNMVNNQTIREVLPLYVDRKYRKLGRYEKFLVNMIKKQSVIGLYCATAYSRYRNKKVGGN